MENSEMVVGVRLRFPGGTVAEFTYTEACEGTPEEWLVMHERTAEKATVERFESDVPINRTTWPNGTVTDYLKEGRERASSA